MICQSDLPGGYRETDGADFGYDAKPASSHWCACACLFCQGSSQGGLVEHLVIIRRHS